MFRDNLFHFSANDFILQYQNFCRDYSQLSNDQLNSHFDQLKNHYDSLSQSDKRTIKNHLLIQERYFQKRGIVPSGASVATGAMFGLIVGIVRIWFAAINHNVSGGGRPSRSEVEDLYDSFWKIILAFTVVAAVISSMSKVGVKDHNPASTLLHRLEVNHQNPNRQAVHYDLVAKCTDYVKEYIQTVTETMADKIAALHLTEEEETLFEEFIDPITNEYMHIPVCMHERYYDISTLVRLPRVDPFNHQLYQPVEIQTARTLVNKLDDVIRNLKATRAARANVDDEVQILENFAPRRSRRRH